VTTLTGPLPDKYRLVQCKARSPESSTSTSSPAIRTPFGTHQHKIGECALLLAMSYWQPVVLKIGVGGAEPLAILHVGMGRSQASSGAGCSRVASHGKPSSEGQGRTLSKSRPAPRKHSPSSPPMGVSTDEERLLRAAARRREVSIS
jgi:hypothetical protein